MHEYVMLVKLLLVRVLLVIVLDWKGAVLLLERKLESLGRARSESAAALAKEYSVGKATVVELAKSEDILDQFVCISA